MLPSPLPLDRHSGGEFALTPCPLTGILEASLPSPPAPLPTLRERGEVSFRYAIG